MFSSRVLFLLVIVVNLSACEFLEVDGCLDRGGRWNYELKLCDENPYEWEVNKCLNSGGLWNHELKQCEVW